MDIPLIYTTDYQVLQFMMLSPAATQRRRLNYFWSRLRDERQTLDDVDMTEKLRLPILRVLLDMNGDMPCIANSRDRLQDYLARGVKYNGNIMVRYRQKDLSEFAPEAYKGSVCLGRFYPRSTATYLPKEVVSTIWGETHMEVDLVSAFPTMLLSAFRDLDLPTLSAYIDNPVPVLHDMKKKFGLERGDIKLMLVTMIGAMPTIPDNLGLEHLDEDKQRGIRESSFFRGMVRDLTSICASLEQHYGPFLEMVRRKCMADPDVRKRQHVLGSALVYMCGDMESVVMRCIMDYFKAFGECSDWMENAIWKFDGLIVPRELLSNLETVSLARHVEEKTGIRVMVAFRGLSNGIRLCVPPEELRQMDRYQEWKVNFEKKFYILENPPVFGYMDDYGIHRELNKIQFQHVTMAEDKDFIKRWCLDPERRLYLGKDVAPPPLFVKDGYLNMWNGFAAEKLPRNDHEVDIQPYLDHVALLMGGDEEAIAYMHRLLAYKFQNPGAIWRVMVFIRSIQGVGKDLWLDFLFGLMGNSLGTRLSKVAELAGQYNSIIEGKLLVGFSEMDAKDSRENVESLKDMITSTRVTIKKKYVASYTINNSTCFIGFSNNFNAMKISSDDRRIFAVTASGYHANKPEYFGPLIKFLDRVDVQRAVYDFYMNIQLGDFDPSGDRVISQTMKDMTEDSLPLGDIFLKSQFHLWIQQASNSFNRDIMFKNNGTSIRLPVRTVYDLFGALATEMKFKDVDSKRKMDLLAKRMLEEASSRIESKFILEEASQLKPIQYNRSHSINYIVFHLQSISKYILAIGGAEDATEESSRVLQDYADGVQAVPREETSAQSAPLTVHVPSFSSVAPYETSRGSYAAGFAP